MNQLKQHPFEKEADQIVQDLGCDLSPTKETFDTGVMYHAQFGEVPIYIALPTYSPSQNENVLRIEFTIGDLAAIEVPQFLFAVSLDLDMNRHCVLRVIARTKDRNSSDMILQAVANVDLIQAGFVASTVLYGAELAQYYRAEFLSHKVAA